MSHLQGQPPPERVRPPTYRVLRVQRDGPLDVTLVSNTLISVVTHWVFDKTRKSGRTHACTQHEGECKQHRHPMEWCAFGPVWDHVTQRKAVLRLAPQEYADLGAFLGIDVDWAWRRVLLTPVNKGEGKRTLVQALPAPKSCAQCPPFPIEATICAVLGIDRIPLQEPAPQVEDETYIPFPPREGAS